MDTFLDLNLLNFLTDELMNWFNCSIFQSPPPPAQTPPIFLFNIQGTKKKEKFL